MSDDPQDLMDQGGRMRRLIAALAIGVGCGVIAYLITWGMARPDELPAPVLRNDGAGGAYRFVFYITGFAFAAGFGITLAIANARAAKRWRDAQVPKARQVS